MWEWLRAHAVSLYGTYWYERGIREYEFVFGRKPFAGMNVEKTMPALKEALSKYMTRASTHWGQGKLNPATIAWVLRQVERDASNGV